MIHSFVRSGISNSQSDCELFLSDKALTQTEKCTSSFLPLYFILFFFLCPLGRLSPGQIWQLILERLEDNAKGQPKPPLFLEGRQQHLLTWPYLSQMLEGTGYFDNSTCISFIFCSNISPQPALYSPRPPFLCATSAVPRGGGNSLPGHLYLR